MNKYIEPAKSLWPEILKRPTRTYDEIEATVDRIFKEVSAGGDAAVRKYAKLFDKADLEDLSIEPSIIDQAEKQLSKELKDAIKLAKINIEIFHKSQMSAGERVQTAEGVVCWQEKRPIEKVGLYIPGGSAPLFSTILMLAVPAKIAGCKEIVMCTPSDAEGNIHPAILFTARLCGIDKVYRIGGIQAIAAMTFGTETVPAVYKLFGPGNQYVTVAKQMALKYGVGIDLPAGPSELLVLADDSADAAFMAADLLSQAEHGADSQVILVSRSLKMLEAIEDEIELQLQDLPRKEIAARAMANSKLIYCGSDDTAMALINFYAPEHLIMNTANSKDLLSAIINAGSVFIGNYTPESAGDYASGTNHTLPTNGFARNFSGVNLDSFQKALTFQEISSEGLAKIGSAIEVMAEAEGLIAHKNAVSIRLKKIDSNNRS